MDLNQDTLYIFTDGSCYPNPGPGGWGTIMIWNGNLKFLYGGSEGETNNTMEFRGILEGLKARTDKVPTIVYSDSQYCVNALTSWWKGWERRGWVTSSGEPVKNQEYIREILQNHDDTITFQWLKGHAGNTFNEAADRLALKGRASIKGSKTKDPDPDFSLIRGMIVPHLSPPKPGPLPFEGAEDPNAPVTAQVGKPTRNFLLGPTLRDTLAGIHFMGNYAGAHDRPRNEKIVEEGYRRADEFILMAKERGEFDPK